MKKDWTYLDNFKKLVEHRVGDLRTVNADLCTQIEINGRRFVSSAEDKTFKNINRI